MTIRRSVFLAQFVAAIVLPLWLLIGRGLLVDGPGWDLVLLLVLAPVLSVLMLVTSALTWARKSVRDARAVSWLDVGLLGALWVSIALAGAVAQVAFAVLVVILVIAAFWSAAWQWFAETRRRVKTAIDDLGFTAVSAEQYRTTRPTTPGRPTSDAPLRGQVIRIEPNDDRHRGD
jgi:hypothetical protein